MQPVPPPAGSSPALAEAEAWHPRPTEGPVPRHVDRYPLRVLSLPKTPSYAKDPHVRSLATELMEAIRIDARPGRLADPWRQVGAWSGHPYFGAGHKIRLAFPGFGLALLAFTGYLVLEHVGVIPGAAGYDGHGHGGGRHGEGRGKH